MKSDKLPEWIEQETEAFAYDFRHSDPETRESEEYKCWEIAYQALHDSSLDKVWGRAKNYASGHSPAQGQMELVTAIYSALQPKKENFATEREAEEWKDILLKKADDLIRHLHQIPRNYNLYPSLYKEIGELCFPAQKLSDFEIDIASGVTSRVAHEALSGKLISVYCDSVKATNYYHSAHKSQVRGKKAEHTYFVRSLSRDIFQLTGQWKRDTVAAITSSVFNCNYNAKEVIRCTKGMDEEPHIDKYPEELQRFKRDDPAPF
jgi:hypothetical protein